MADRVIDLLMKSKNDSGGYDIMLPITKTANVKTAEAITVMTSSNIGSYKNNDVIAANTPIDTIIKRILQQHIPPTYTSPSVNLTVTGTAKGNYEVGTSCTPVLVSSFIGNDAGAVTSHEIKKNGTVVTTGSSTSLSHTETFTLGDETVNFVGYCSYAVGAIKNDNFGEPYSEGHIAAGTKTSNTISYTGFRKYFYAVDAGTTAATTSSDIRGMTGSTSAPTNGTTFNISVTAGQRRVTFAYPATLRDVSSIQYVENSNDESKDFFTKTTVDVEGANGATAISYKVYTYIPSQAFPANMTFKVII